QASTDAFDEIADRAMQVNDLARLVIRPLPVEAKHGDAPLVLHVRIDFAVAIVVGDHVAAAREAHEGAVIAAGLLLELPSVAAARDPLITSPRAHAGHAPAGGELDVIPAGKIELARQ